MARRDPRVDAYIAKSAPFARPILKHLRAIVHAGCPGVTETLKWSTPHFEYHGVLAGMAAFKAHCVFHFWKGSLIVKSGERQFDAMGQFGRITSLDDLPPKGVLLGFVRKAGALNESGERVERPLKHPKPKLAPPAELVTALKRSASARATFEAFPPSKQREYSEWISDAKSQATRERRLAQAIEWLAEGKSRHWKYQTLRRKVA
jgi:uncharacterized protein YdeI (YjbR/CyaY-like superfamily)